jgi:chromate transporter
MMRSGAVSWQALGQLGAYAGEVQAHIAATERSKPVSERTLRGIVAYFLRLGAYGFGGPIALVGYMHRDLVDRRRWFSDDEYRQGLALAQTMPGPLAAQLAMWLGFLTRGVVGAASVALAFVAPPFLLVTTVAVIYVQQEGSTWVHSLFRGVGPAIVAIIAIASVKLARTTNKRDPSLWAVAAGVCAITVVAGAEIIWLFLAAGIFGAIIYGGGLPKRNETKSLGPLNILASVKGLALTGSGAGLGTLGLFFLQAGAFTFGSGLAVVPFLHQGLVSDHHWLTEHQFVDCVAIGIISPGPVVIIGTVAGYLVFGITGAVVATVAVFLPAFVLVVLLGRVYRRHADHPRVKGFVSGATAAASGAIAGAAIVIAKGIVDDVASVAIVAASLIVLLQKRVRMPEPALIATAAAFGLVAFG